VAVSAPSSFTRAWDWHRATVDPTAYYVLIPHSIIELMEHIMFIQLQNCSTFHFIHSIIATIARKTGILKIWNTQNQIKVSNLKTD